jgi:hypothetical protein
MYVSVAVAVAAGVVAAAAPLFTPAVAHAEPVVPQQNAECSKNFTGALTQLPDLNTLLECRNQPGAGNRWQMVDDPYPNSDRWLTYGPKLTLHGEGQRNREINSGDWTGYPLDSGSRCDATQLVVVPAGNVGEPQVSKGELGQPLRLQVMPLLFTIELNGNCLWEKVD